MFEAKVYKIAILSLSDLVEETFAAKESVRQWTVANAERSGKLFLTVDDPQTADILVGVVGNWLEKTDLIEDSLNAGKRVLLLFNTHFDPENTIPSEQTAVMDYMNQMQQRCYCAEFNGKAQLGQLVNEQLEAI